MRLLIVAQNFWPESFVINDVAKTLMQYDYEVTVLTGKPNYPSGDFFDGYKFWECKPKFGQEFRSLDYQLRQGVLHLNFS